jgi:hypothetical protein
VRERCEDLFGRDGWRWRVVRTSNAYVFNDPASSKSEKPTKDQNLLSLCTEAAGLLKVVVEEGVGARASPSVPWFGRTARPVCGRVVASEGPLSGLL